MISKHLHRHQLFYYLFSLIVLIISALVYCYLNNYFTELVLVHTSYGTVQGFTSTSRDGRKFYQFNAIPYAKPPVGQLRFQAPEPVEPWDFVDGTRMTPVCPQFDMVVTNFRGQEDCLFLNVFTTINPTSSRKKLLPVMVFIHGGIFMFGGSWDFYGGRYFMEEDVVLITLNYRLGLLGFLNTGDDVVPGNMGLKDQVEALKFLKRIVPNFGGDPQRITLFGESAGGASVHYHMLSPQSKGLFQNAISQSGSAFCPWAFQRRARDQAIRVGNQVGCPTTSSKQLVECFLSMDVWSLIEPHKNLMDIFIDPLDIFGPSVENATSEDGRTKAFLTEYPYKLAAEGKTHSIPWLTGINSHEGCFRSSWFVGQKKLLDRLNTEWDSLASNAFFLFRNDTKTLDKLWKRYFAGKQEISLQEYQSLTNLIGDRLFTLPVRDAALLHAKHHGKKVPTYMYYYSQKSEVSFADFLSSFATDSPVPRVLQILVQFVQNLIYKWLDLERFDFGACHTDDLFQIMSFNPTTLLDITKGHPHYHFSLHMVKTWAQFASDGEPGSFDGVPWERINLSENSANNTPTQAIPKYLHLNAKQSEMIQEPFHHRIPFWHQLKLPRNLNPDHETIYNYDVMKPLK